MNPMSDTPDNRLFDAGDLPAAKSLFVRDLREAQDVDTVLLVKERTLAQKRNGADYLRLKVCDCTGTLDAMVWDGARDMHELAAARHRDPRAGPVRGLGALRRPARSCSPRRRRRRATTASPT